ncbi:ABC transporter substrate-binding protein [Maridesulfovibrio sp.]|uniref:ABC transporter substrate-binding protein n=1 Tax=Maridesulfovibrio sp. TaxID=2795000 RepID=UPI003BA9A267
MSRISLVSLALALVLIQVTALPAFSSNQKPYIIAGPRGDWGFPAPLAHIKKGPGYALTSLLFDTLVWKNEAGEIIPALAQKWQQEGGGKIWTFGLNKKAKWHDGRNVTAEDVVFSINFLHEKSYPFAKLDVIESAKAVDESTVRIQLKHPFAPFLTFVAGSMPVLPEHIYKNLDETEFSSPKAAIGSGPYKFGSYSKTHKRYVFTANPEYYVGRARFSSIIFLKMSPGAAVKSITKGKIDMMRKVAKSQLVSLDGTGLQILEADSGHPVRLLFNHRKSQFKSLHARKGVAFALDAEKLAVIAAQGAALPNEPGGMPYSSNWKESNVPRYPYSQAKALEQFNKTGWKTDFDGKVTQDGKAVHLRLLTEKKYMGAAKVIASQLAEVGIVVDVTSTAPNIFKTRLKDMDFDMALASRSALGDPQNYANVVIGNSPYGDRFNSNAELARILEVQAETVSDDDRLAMVKEAQKIYASELPAYQLYTPVWYAAANVRARVWFTEGGIGHGVPLPLNKLIFLE